MAILNCALSSGRHIYGILSVGVPFLGVQHVRPEVILLLQYQSFPIQQSKAKFQFGIDYVPWSSSSSFVVSKSGS